MGILFLILFSLTEIALVVLTVTKFADKAAWLQNRAIVRVVETVLMLGIVLLPTTYAKWRFLAALVILVLRLLVAGISWLVNRSKVTGTKTTVRTVVNCVLSMLLIAFSLVPAFVFANYNGLTPTGKYQVCEATAILVDQNRLDPFETDDSFREVPAHFYYPENAQGSFPLVVFSHGAFGYYQSNYSTYAELVSNGYVVVALDHPHHSFFTKDTNGKIILVDNTFIDNVMRISQSESINTDETFILSHEWLKLRTDDENFVLDSIKEAKAANSLGSAWKTNDAETILQILASTDTDKIGLAGHSLGGASSVQLGRERDDIDAIVDLDGTMLGEIIGVADSKEIYNSTPYPVPALDLTRESSYNDREQYKLENGFPYVNEYIVSNAVDSRTVVLANAEHMDFTDLPMFSPVLGSLLGHGDVDSEALMTRVNSITLAWFNYYLKGEGTLDIQAKY